MTTRLSTALRQRLNRVRANESDAGFTILEVLVAFVLFTIVSITATVAMVNALNAAHSNQQRIDATNLAQNVLDTTRARADDQVPGFLRVVTPPIREKETFIWERTITFPGAATQCSLGTAYTVSVAVYQQQTQKFLARVDSVITC